MGKHEVPVRLLPVTKRLSLTHIGIHIVIGMFNSNPMIPQDVKLVEYSQRYLHLC